MKVLVTGANGLLGQQLITMLLRKDVEVIGTGKGPSRIPFQGSTYSYYDIDIREPGAWTKLFSVEHPDGVVHAAAMTQVDECELEKERCYAVNVLGTEYLLHAISFFKPFFIYVSTDFVFDGEKGNYREEDPLAPVNWYGHTKQSSEELVGRSSLSWAIVRTCLVYGNALHGTRSNIISWVKDKLSKNEKIRVVDDQLRTPTHVADLAKGIVTLLEKRIGGIFHLSGKDLLSPYEIAMRTADYCGLDKTLIERVNAAVFSQAAKRPPKTGFIIDKARKELQFEPMSFQEGLALQLSPDKWNDYEIRQNG